MMRLLVGVVVARPLTEITLPNIITHQVAVDFISAWSTLFLIDHEVQSGRRLLRKAAHPRYYSRRELLKKQAFGHLTKHSSMLIFKAPEGLMLNELVADKIQRVFEIFLAKKAMGLQTSMVICHGIYSTSLEHLLATTLDQWMTSKGPCP